MTSSRRSYSLRHRMLQKCHFYQIPARTIMDIKAPVGHASISVGFDSDVLYSGMTGVGNYCFHLLKALMLDYTELRFSGFTGLRWQLVAPTDLDRIERSQSKRQPETESNAESSIRQLWHVKNALRTRLARMDVVRSSYRQLRAARFAASRPPSEL